MPEARNLGVSPTFARDFTRDLDHPGYLQIGYSRGTMPTSGGTSLRGWCLSFQRVSAASESGGTGPTKVWAPVSVLAEQRGG
jgi:hypothetical protein